MNHTPQENEPNLNTNSSDEPEVNNPEQDDQEYISLRQKRQERQRQAQLQRLKRQRLILAIVGIVICVLLLAVLIHTVSSQKSPVLKKVTVEAGTAELTASVFLKNADSDIDISFVTDVSEISLDHTGSYSITLNVNGKERTSTLIIQDTIAPEGKAEAIFLNLGAELAAEDLLVEISDATDVICDFKDKADFSKEGTYYPVVLLTDEGGNTTEVTGAVTVIIDEEAPVIDGVAHLSAFIDVPVSYKANVTVTDNCDTEVELVVDTSAVNASEEGTYDVVYSATDSAGNTAEETTTITFTEKPDTYVDEETVLAEAQEVLDEILTDDMTLKQEAQVIYTWVRENLSYVNSSEKDSWTNGAHQGFTEGSGDCFIYFSTAKALLTQAGIPNIDVEKSNIEVSRHYWSLINVGDGWYHFDTTPREDGETFFLVTDEEMLAYFESEGIYDAFDTSLYPATPTVPSTIE